MELTALIISVISLLASVYAIWKAGRISRAERRTRLMSDALGCRLAVTKFYDDLKHAGRELEQLRQVTPPDLWQPLEQYATETGELESQSSELRGAVEKLIELLRDYDKGNKSEVVLERGRGTVQWVVNEIAIRQPKLNRVRDSIAHARSLAPGHHSFPEYVAARNPTIG